MCHDLKYPTLEPNRLARNNFRVQGTLACRHVHTLTACVCLLCRFKNNSRFVWDDPKPQIFLWDDLKFEIPCREDMMLLSDALRTCESLAAQRSLLLLVEGVCASEEGWMACEMCGVVALGAAVRRQLQLVHPTPSTVHP